MLLHTLHIADTFEVQASLLGGSLLGLHYALGEQDIDSSYCAAINTSIEQSVTPEFTLAPTDSLETLIANTALVHIHGWGTEFTRVAASVACKHNKPYVISSLGKLVSQPVVRESRFGQWRSRLRDKRLINKAFCLTASNDAEYQALGAKFPHLRIETLPYGLDFDLFRSINPDFSSAALLPEGKILLYLGPIHPEQGLVPLLKSFAEQGLDAQGWGMVLAGDDVEGWQAQLEAAIRRKGAVEQVTFVGTSSLSTQRYLLSRASILAVTGLHFSCPATILQAVACEVPVLASKQLAPAGLEQVIRLCEPTRESIRPALATLMTCSDEQRKSMATQALRAGRDMADWSACAKSWATLYQQVIQ